MRAPSRTNYEPRQLCFSSSRNPETERKMLRIPFLLFLPILFVQISLLPAVPKLDPDPALIPSTLVLSIISSPNSATVPAFPEQSAAVVPCPLDLPPALLHSVSAACSAPETPSLPSRTLCFPALAAWLFSAHSAADLATRPPPLSSSASTADLPILPDDSESCAAAAEAALRDQGVVLPRPNDTCDVAYCYCGIRLGPLRCPGSFAASASEGRWVVAREDTARSLERDCARPGLGGLHDPAPVASRRPGGGSIRSRRKERAFEQPPAERSRSRNKPEEGCGPARRRSPVPDGAGQNTTTTTKKKKKWRREREKKMTSCCQSFC